MPIISCPKCQGKARFPEDSPPRRVKCPSCGNVYLSSDGGASVFAPPPASNKKRESKSDFKFDDRDDDRPPRRRRDEDEEDDRRSRRREEDEPRSRRRRPREADAEDRRSRRRDEEDYDDRPRRRRDQEDYDRDRGRHRPDPDAIEGQFNRASLGCLLNFIAGWLQVGALGLMAFIVLLDWCGVQEGLKLFAVIAGLLGLGHWLTSATGLGFFVSGPRQRGALGLSVATAATAALHLLLIIIVATSHYYGQFGSSGPGRTADVHWDGFVTQLRSLPTVLFVVIGFDELFRRTTDGTVLPIFANVAEIARMILLLLTLRSLMVCARDSRGASLAMRTMVGYAIALGGLLLIGILFGLLFLAVRPTRMEPGDLQTINAVIHLFFLVLYLVLVGMAVVTTLVVRVIKGNIDYRR